MAARAPKQWPLSKQETITSFENWRQNILYVLSLDPKFEPYLEDNASWLKKSPATPNRGFTDDTARTNIPKQDRLSAAQKAKILELMLGQIANFCPVISRNSIVKSSTSLSDIWQQIRQHYGFQLTGAHFLDLASFQLESDERPEDLYQRLLAFFEDNMLCQDSAITHHGEKVDEDMSPSVENTVVVLWLKLIHPNLPQLVKQRYGTELRNKTLASLKPEISQALDSLLDDVRSIEEAKAMRISDTRFSRKTSKSCTLCRAARRPGHDTHFISTCKFLPDADRKAIMARARLTQDVNPDDPDVEDYAAELYEETHEMPKSTARRVDIIASPYLNTFYDRFHVKVTLDTGATTNMVKASFAKYIGLPIGPASQMARQADGVTPLQVVGETHCSLSRGQHNFQLDALVVEHLDVDVLGGNPFHCVNDISSRPSKQQIVLNGSTIIQYGVPRSAVPTVRRTQAHVLHNTDRHVIMPGEFVEVKTPGSPCDTYWALEPRYDTKRHQNATTWLPPQEILAIDNTIRVPNLSDTPVLLGRNEHFCQVRSIGPVLDGCEIDASTTSIALTSQNSVATVRVDPDGILSPSVRDAFTALHRSYSNVFDPAISKYNGFSGSIEGHVNMGPVLPPQRKGRLPTYNREKMVELQAKFDELEKAGVFLKPEDAGVTVEYLNLSFLVQKPSGGSRLVTSFGEVGQYSKPQPALMPNVDDTLRDIGRWKYIIVSDLLKSFYQIPLAKSSMKYCGVTTPYKGVRVYARCAMGMPGSETCLEELMSRVLGGLVQEGHVAKIADDLYCGADSPEELLIVWENVLHAISNNNLRLSASKTIVCPKTATILGWTWSRGTLRASPHRIATLSAVQPPSTVHGLRSFIGAFKVLSRVLRGYADLMHPLEMLVAGKSSKEKISWDEDTLTQFKSAQSALMATKTITLPLPSDELWIVTDGSVSMRGLAATLYLRRGSEVHLGGFFNAKMKQYQVTWLPCEVEALCICAAIKHFAPYIIQSCHPAQVLTDSRPCVQAYEKLCRGEFSNSSRVCAFLSTVSRYQAQITHIPGTANIPSDFSSRNPRECEQKNCQVCQFVFDTQDSVARELSVTDIMDGSTQMPFTNRTSWLTTQRQCPDLRRVHAHLTQGTRPQKKAVKIPDVKKYLRVASVAQDGLLVVKTQLPFQSSHQQIVIPRSVLHGFLTAVHLRFTHPTVHQMKRLIKRYFYALGLEKAIQDVVSHCHHCLALRNVPALFHKQTSTPAPAKIGISFASDVLRRERQFILVLRETVSSYTVSTLINNEQANTLREGLLYLAADLRPLGDHTMHVRVDPAPGFVSLQNDSKLQALNIQLEVGEPKNPNKNPVAEKAVQELSSELRRLCPNGGAITSLTLKLATANLNARLRHQNLSSREIWLQRDQISGEQLTIQDDKLCGAQQAYREANHLPSARTKSKGSKPIYTTVNKGSLVYLFSDYDKHRARNKYIVMDIQNNDCVLKKFTDSQLRNRLYTVKLSDVYCIPTHSPDNREDCIDNEHGSDTEPESESTSHNSVNAQRPPGVIVNPQMQSQSESEPMSSSDESIDRDSQENHVDRRYLRRARKAPQWMRSGEWEV